MMFVHEIYIVVSIEAPVYLSSQSYMADSSLSEEMSQFDFSTGVQSFSISSQNPEGGHRRTVAKRVSHVIFFVSLIKLHWACNMFVVSYDGLNIVSKACSPRQG